MRPDLEECIQLADAARDRWEDAYNMAWGELQSSEKARGEVELALDALRRVASSFFVEGFMEDDDPRFAPALKNLGAELDTLDAKYGPLDHRKAEDPPYVCPGCFAVAPERCAPGCIDAEIEEADNFDSPDWDEDDWATRWDDWDGGGDE